MALGATFPLAVVIRGIDKLTTPLGKAGGSLGRFGSKATKVGAGLTAGVTTPVIGLGAMVIRTAAQFESSMLRVQALTNGSKEEMAGLEQQARTMGATTQFSAKQAAEGQGFLAQAGFNLGEIQSGLPSIMALAGAGILDLATAADLGSNVLTGYALKNERLGNVVDQLAGVQAKANTNVEQAAEAMKLAGPVAAGMNQKFEDTVAIVGALGNAGFQGTLAGTALRGALVKITQVTPAAGRVLSKLKINPDDLRTSTGELRSMVDIIGLLEERGANAEQLMAIFGQRAGPALVSLVAQGSESIRELREEIAGVSAADVAAIQMSGAAGAALTLKSAFEELQLAIGDSGLLENFKDAVGWLTQWIRGLSESDPKMLKLGVLIAGVAAAMGPLILVGGVLLSGLGGLVTVGGVLGPLFAGWATVLFTTVIPATWAWTVALLANPVGLVVVGIVALIAAGWALWKNWDKVVGFLGGLWSGLKSMVGGVVDFLLGKVRSLMDFLPDWMVKLLQGTNPAAALLFGAAESRRPAEDLGSAAATVAGGGGGLTETVRDARVQVDFGNLPEGASVTRDPAGGDAELDLSTGGLLQVG